jgi:hypothetical protein
MTENASANELLLKPNPYFAQKLDANCNQCLEKKSDNRPQVETLRQRERTHPEEAPFLNALRNKCQTCQRRFGHSIKITHSCMYRGGIYKKPQR